MGERAQQNLESAALVFNHLQESSAAALDFLTSSLGVDLSSVVRLGGHSAPRTRSNPAGPNVGLALVKAAEAAARALPNVRIITGARVTAVAYARQQGQQQPDDGSGGALLTVTYEQQGQPSAAAATTATNNTVTTALPARAVVFASGGFAASRPLLARHRPDLAALPTTNGAWATGDGLALAAALGARLTQLDAVQVHPTGFAGALPSQEGAAANAAAAAAPGPRFLAPEKLRGCGAVLLGADGRRFVDELGTRAAVVEAMMGARRQGKGDEKEGGGGGGDDGGAWLVLGAEGAARFGEGALRFYASKGLMHEARGVGAAAALMGVDAAALEAELREYDAAVEAAAAAAAGSGSGSGSGNSSGEGQQQQPPASPAAAAAAAAAVTDRTGKRFFPSRVLGGGGAGSGGGAGGGGASPSLWVARVAPVVHYTMGGIAVDADARALGAGDGEGGGAPLRGVFAAGEAAGGLHGANRLGGNSLAECVVFGRVAGAGAAKEALAGGAGAAKAQASAPVAAAAASEADGGAPSSSSSPKQRQQQQRPAVIASAM